MFSRLFGRSSHNQSGTVKTASALSEDPCSTRTETFQNTSQPNIGREASQEQTVRKVAAPSPSNDNTESLSDQIEIIEKRQNVLEVKIQKEVEKAKQYLEKKNKTGATQCLQRKKIYEGQLTKLQSQLMNIERIRLAVEENIMNVEVMKAQRLAANDLKRLQQGMTPEQVDKDMDDLRDLMDKTAEVSEALAQDVGNDVADEDDIEQELAALQQETVNEKMANNLASGMADFIPKPSLNVPHTTKQDVNLSENSQKNLNDLSDSLTAQLATMTVPRGKIGASHRTNDEEDELAALERELNS